MEIIKWPTDPNQEYTNCPTHGAYKTAENPGGCPGCAKADKENDDLGAKKSEQLYNEDGSRRYTY